MSVRPFKKVLFFMLWLVLLDSFVPSSIFSSNIFTWNGHISVFFLLDPFSKSRWFVDHYVSDITFLKWFVGPHISIIEISIDLYVIRYLRISKFKKNLKWIPQTPCFSNELLVGTNFCWGLFNSSSGMQGTWLKLYLLFIL